MKIEILHKKENDDGVRISEKITQNIRMAGGSTFIRIIHIINRWFWLWKCVYYGEK